jgi:predicted exporter
MVAPLLARDPTLETLRVLQAWSPATEPERYDGVWFSASGTQALLLVQTRAAGFDPVGQQAALARIRGAHAALAPGPTSALEISGPGAFAERMADQTRREASRLGAIATLALILLLGFAYRSPSRPWYGALVLASGAVCGLLAVVSLFDSVHGITLAFGFTLLGVAQDYPVHLFSHARPREAIERTARQLWPTLIAGTGSSCLAYAVFWFAGVDGLRQLAVFTVVGLAVAALATRYLLPRVVPDAARDAADSRWVHFVQQRLARRAAPPWLAIALALAALAALGFAPTPWWEDDLATLTPVPTELLERDRELRAELGAPDVRWLLVLHAADSESVLQRSEAVQPLLAQAVAQGTLTGFEHAAQYLPSSRTQRERQAHLPDGATLQTTLRQARAELPFSPTAFDPFLAAVERARHLPPLTPAMLDDTPLQLRIETLMRPAGDDVIGLILLNGLRDPAALQTLAAGEPDLHLVDLKHTAEGLAGAWRGRVLWAMVGAAVVLCLGIAVAVRDRRRAARVLVPVGLGTLVLVAGLHAAGVQLTLFHLISLVLAACLGVDYALFLERAGGDATEQRRTLHALAVCVLSTLFVFALLATSQTPVLRAIGATVSFGVLIQILLAIGLSARPSAAAEPT